MFEETINLSMVERRINAVDRFRLRHRGRRNS